MTHEEMLGEAGKAYAQARRPSSGAAREPFPGPPEGTFAPEEYLERLTEAAFYHSAKLRHPFAVGVGQGRWRKAQMQEWVRQDYQWTIHVIRRHALVAAHCADYETLTSLLTHVKVEADADPVGGSFFALPQLWTKWGIALGLTREEVLGWPPDPQLKALNEALVAEAPSSAGVPAREFVDALLNPVFYQLWGEALENSLRLPHDALDYFWAVASDRWGEDMGRSILLRWAESPQTQQELWNQYRDEAQGEWEWQRFSILERLLESAPA